MAGREADPSTSSNDEAFSGEITVSSRIIDELSSGLYESPSACLKELVNNSYDADARVVDMLVKPDADVIVIEDDGIGISKAEFERHFKRIARSYKREESDRTPSGRPVIGKIGIGFIAANEICDRMQIESTKAGSQERLSVTIDFAAMRSDLQDRERGEDALRKADYEGTVTNDAEPDEHYTRLLLLDVRGEARDILAGARPGRGTQSLYGLSPETVRERLLSPSLNTWDEFDSYSKSLLELGLYVPVAYHDDWIPPAYQAAVQVFTEQATSLDFVLRVDGSEIRKPTVLPDDPDGVVVHGFDFEGEHVAGNGYLYARSGALKPRELNGLLVRIRNAAAGGYDRSFLDFPGYESPLLQDWASGEIWVDDGLEDALNIDRKTLRITHPAYVELQALVHQQLRSFFSTVRRDLYGARSARRREEQADKQLATMTELASSLEQFLGKRPASRLLRQWEASVEVRDRQRRRGRTSPRAQALTRKFAAATILKMAGEAAQEAGLDPDEAERLLSELGRILLD